MPPPPSPLRMRSPLPPGSPSSPLGSPPGGVRLAPALGRALPSRPREPLLPARPPPQYAPWGESCVPPDDDHARPPWADGNPVAPVPPAVLPAEQAPATQRPAPPPPLPPPPRRQADPLDWLLEPPEERLPALPSAVRPPPAAPDQPARPRRLGRSLYDAEETHGAFGLVNTGRVSGGVRALVAHVPRRGWVGGLDVRPGDVVYANSARGTHAVGGALCVVYVTRHKYFAPGRSVTSCVLGVPDDQWLAAFGA